MVSGIKLFLTLSALLILKTIIYANSISLLESISKRQGFANAESYLAVEMYKKCLVLRGRRTKINEKSDQSFGIAPLSITGAFLALQNGLNEDRAADEIWMFLGYERSKVNSEDAHAEYTKFLNKEQRRTSWPPHYILEIGNFIISDTSLSLLKEYQTKMEKDYNAAVKEEEFHGNETALVKEMNSWIKNKTRGSIHNMIGQLKSQIKLMILSTSFFMGKWENEFDPKLTKNAPFLCENGESKIVQMMQADGRVEYTKNDEYFALELHFNGDRIRFFILCPKDPGRLHKLEETLTFEQLLEIRQKMTPQKIRTFLPKLKIEFKRKLKDDASELQVKKIFIPDATSFGGMTAKDYMFVSQVYHLTVIDMHEKYANASGATTIAVSRSQGMRRHRSRVRRKCTTKTHLSSNSSKYLRVYNGIRDNASPSHFMSAVILDEKDLNPIYLDDTNTWLSDEIGSTPKKHKASHKLVESDIKEVKIDRPFLLAILQSDYDMIWFLGRVFECPKA